MKTTMEICMLVAVHYDTTAKLLQERDKLGITISEVVAKILRERTDKDEE